MKTLTKKFLTRWSACKDGVAWFKKCGEKNVVKVCERLIAEKHFAWCGWLIARVLDKRKSVEWACFCAEQVLDNFEKQYPDDDRPRKAIQAAKDFLDGKITKDAAASADSAAYSAAYSADSAAYSAADSAAYSAADSAAYSAASAASAAYSAASADSAAYSAADSAAYSAASESMYIKVLTKGIEMMRGGKK